MNFYGKWACTDYLDTQLNVMPDGEVYITYSDLGEYSIKANAEYIDDKLKWTALGISGEVYHAGKDGNYDILKGVCTSDSAKTDVVFYSTDEEPEALPYHHAPFNETVLLSDDFPYSLSTLTGQWLANEPITVEMNIFERDGKMLLHLSFDRRTLWIPVSVWCEGENIVWQINDAFNRAVCTLHYENGDLIGFYKQIWRGEGPVRFSKLSDIPVEHEEFQPDVERPNKTRMEILLENASYNSSDEKADEEYVLGGKIPEYVEKYGYSDYISEKTGDDLVFACLDYICDNFVHYGNSGMPPYRERSLADFIMWCSKHDSKTNCRGLSIMLAAVLRYNGIKAQHITCMPYEEPFDDCHVVVDCHMPSGKRIMLDPTYRLYFRDECGEYVSLPRLRKMLICNEKLIPNESAEYTGDRSPFILEDYRNYMIKNTIRFTRDSLNADGRDEFNQVVLYPAEYPCEKITSTSPDALILTDDTAFWN